MSSNRASSAGGGIYNYAYWGGTLTLSSSKPVPKVIDFGIAKATGPHLTDMTLFTKIDQVIGTPLYMSPEQAGLSRLDIDTRSDIYSLGVLLYELLTGTTPCDKERLKEAAFDEVRRIIREFLAMLRHNFAQATIDRSAKSLERAVMTATVSVSVVMFPKPSYSLAGAGEIAHDERTKCQTKKEEPKDQKPWP